MKPRALIPVAAMLFAAATFTPQSQAQAQNTNIWNFNYTGSIVDWTVPSTGIYDITAYGAQGGVLSGFTSGGKGAQISGSFTLTEGEVLSILVGGLGQSGGGQNMGGGGGSFVVNSSTNPLVVAGGGGGRGLRVGVTPTINASTNTWGHNGESNVPGIPGFSFPPDLIGSGGTNGNGGTIGEDSPQNGGAGGGGFYTDGGTHLVTTSGTDKGQVNVAGGSSYISGGAGGSGGFGYIATERGLTPVNGGDGGFGGGGQAGSGGGGGGGYSGGGGGAYGALGYGFGAWFFGLAGGGGGSFLEDSASNAVMTIGRKGNGLVSIAQVAATLLVGNNSSDQSITISSGTNDYYDIVIGSNAGDTNNSISVVNGGTVVDAANNILVGQNGSDNTMSVSNGASVVNLGSSVIGLNATASDNSLLVTGAGSTWSSGTALLIGSSGSGNNLTVEAGAGVVSEGSGVALGYNVGSSGNSLLIDGVGSSLADSDDFVVGFSGSGNEVVISNGGNLTNGQHIYGGVIGLNSGAINNSVLVTGNGSAWNNGGDLSVGWSDSGNTLTVSNGGAVTSSQINYGGVIGFNAASSNNNIVVTGTGSSWINSGDLLVGVSGSGNNMTISAGGNVSSGQVDYGGVIGFNASSLSNSVLVTGNGSAWNNSGNLTIGDAGEGTLTIANGGSVSANSITIASQVGSTGTLNFGSLGGSDTAGSLIGPGISFGSGSGTINFNQVDSLIGSGFSGNGSLNQLGTGTTTLSGNNTYTGTTTVNSGTLVVYDKSFQGTSSLMLNGGTMILAGSGSSWNTGANTLIVGNNSPGVSLVVSNGASLTSGSGILGQDSGASNNSILVTGAGSTWTNESSLYVGDRSSGNSVKVSAGATVSVFALQIGNYASGNSLEVSDGGQLVTGGDGFGSCIIGLATGSSNNSVLVTGSGSSWNNNNTMNIGYYGSGAVTVANGGSMTAGYLSISGYGGSGALNIGRLGSDDTAGTFSAWSLALRTGGVINFNQSDSTTFSTVISGTGSVNQLGSGTTILTGNNNAYNGTTTVNAGTLLANNTEGSAVGSSAVTVNSGGTLGGNGTIGGATTIASGGNLAPGSSGADALSFSAGLTLESGSTTSFLINATGDFTSINILGNNINFGGELIFNIASYTPTVGDSFTLFNMTGGATQSGGFSSVSAGSLFFTESEGIWSASYGDYAYQFSQSTGQLSVEASQAVPEPSQVAASLLLVAGIVGFVIVRRRKALAA